MASRDFCKYLQVFKLFFLLYCLDCLRCTAHAPTRQIDRDATTIYYLNTPPNARGEFLFDFQTTNGITTKAAGNEHGHSGVVQYVSLEGIPVTWTYVADEDGYHPTGSHIPTTPPHVLKSLEYLRTHPQVDEVKSRRLR